MSSAPKYIPHYTIDDYRLWDGDWELWGGVAVAMTPSPFGRHGHLIGRVATALNLAIDAAMCHARVLVEVDWIVARDTVVRPDLSVICGDAPEHHIEETPGLIVEILSDGTRERDLTHKRDLFEQKSVRWYWIVDPLENTLDALWLNARGVYEQADTNEVNHVRVDLCEDCILDVDTSWLFR